jgi:hypothetical protein
LIVCYEATYSETGVELVGCACASSLHEAGRNGSGLGLGTENGVVGDVRVMAEVAESG